MKIVYVAIIVIVISIIVVSLILGIIAQSPPVQIKNMATDSDPCFFEDGSVRWGEITDFAVCGRNLYILYENKGVLDCYTLDGEYEHSYYVDLGQKGRSALYVKEETLYLKSNGLTFYTFREGSYETSYEVSAAQLYPETDNLNGSKREANEASYELRVASIWRCGDEKSERIIHRPAYLAVFQGSRILIFGSAAFILLCYLLTRFKHTFY